MSMVRILRYLHPNILYLKAAGPLFCVQSSMSLATSASATAATEGGPSHVLRDAPSASDAVEIIPLSAYINPKLRSLRSA